MIVRLLACGAVSLALSSPKPSAPAAVVVATTRGEASIPVALHRGHPALPVPPLTRLLPVTALLNEGWAEVTFGGEPFKFLLDVGVVVHRGRALPLAGGAYVQHDTLYVPLQWLAEIVPSVFHEGYRYDPLGARLEEKAATPVITRVSRGSPNPISPAAVRLGLRRAHTVVVDAGHGGHHPGNPGRYFPRGVQEKHVTLAIAKYVKAELEKRGIAVRMTRTEDAYLGLRERGLTCDGDCDLFLSIHVNSLDPAPGYERKSGVETFYLAEARTREAARVAEKENEDARSEGPVGGVNPLSLILNDLQSNEFLRESADLADLIQQRAVRVHPGGGSRGVAQAEFVVLYTARRPAVLVETGYATNRGDAQFLMSPSGRIKLAAAIADGVVAYLLRYEEKLGQATGEPGR